MYPRQLNRWLDKNPVAKLTRNQAYFVMPAFEFSVEDTTYSNLVGAFNYEAGNNFTIKSYPTPDFSNIIPSIIANFAYVICVMWKDSLLNTHRYALWQDVGEVFYFDVPLYEGQKIGKNFRLEIWSVPIGTGFAGQVSSDETTFYTSLRGGYDYMWQDDFTIATTSNLISIFGEDERIPGSHSFSLPLTFPADSTPTIN